MPAAAIKDPADSKATRWFIPARTVKDSSGKPIANQTVWAQNEVEAFLEAHTLWTAIMNEIVKTSGSSHFIYIAGMILTPNTDMTVGRGKRKDIGPLLTEADGRGVAVRALLPPYGTHNNAAISLISALTHGAAIEDDKRSWAHHQKVIVIANSEGLVGFCGGVDIDPDRNNWHDVHCRVRGPAAQDLQRNFVERWRDHPDSATLQPATNRVVASPGSTQKGSGDKHVQFVRTLGKGAGYSFAPDGEYTIYELIRHAIAKAEQFIYLEDQYLVAATKMQLGPAISTLLADKLKESSFKKLIVLIPRTEALNKIGEFGTPHRQGWARRKTFIDELHRMGQPAGGSPAVKSTKVIVCQHKILKPKQAVTLNDPKFVHSKTWIFDDKFAICGSANCDRRGYTANSEANVGVADENAKADRAFFAHDLRINLWLAHLNPHHPASPIFQKEHLVDPIAASTYFECPHPDSLIQAYDTNGEAWLKPPNDVDTKDNPGSSPDADWDKFDPDQSHKKVP